MASERSLTVALKRIDPQVGAGWGIVLLVFVATYWKTILWVVNYAQHPDYQYCYFVPGFSLALLWLRRDKMGNDFSPRFSYWSLAFFALWGAMRWFHAYYYYPTLDGVSMVPFFAGVTLALGGWRALLWAWPSIIFLIFMYPLPGRLQEELRFPLQLLATKLSVFLIQTIGIPASASGIAINLSEPPPLEVAAVCSGLRMLMVFVTICVGAAFVMKGPVWERLVIVVSSVPIAIFSNVLRITATGIQREYFSSPDLDLRFHDIAGLAMPPLALVMAWAEITLLRKLFPNDDLDTPLAFAVESPRSNESQAATIGQP